MKSPSLFILLTFLFTLPSFTAQEPPFELIAKDAQNFPRYEFSRDENDEATLHLFHPKDLKEGEFFGLRFEVPASRGVGNLGCLILDLGQSETPAQTFEIYVLTSKGEPIISKPSSFSTELDGHTRLQERFPTMRGMTHLVTHPSGRPKLKKECLLIFRPTEGPMPPIALGLTLTSEKGAYEFGQFPLWRKPLPRFLDADAFLKEVVALRSTDGDETALEHLAQEFTRRTKFSYNFKSLHRAAWIEGQVRSGRDDALWNSQIIDLVFTSSHRYLYFDEAFKIIPNLVVAMTDAKRHGRRADILAMWVLAIKDGGYQLDPTTYPDRGPALPELPQVRRRDIPTLTPLSKTVFEGFTPRSVPEAFDRFTAYSFISWAFDCTRRGQWQEALEWLTWIMEWSQNSYAQQKDHEIGAIWYGAAEGLAHGLNQLGFEEATMEVYRQILQSDIVDAYGNRSHHRAEAELLAWEIKRGLAPPDQLARLHELAEKIRTNRYGGASTHAEIMTQIATVFISLGKTQEGLTLLDDLTAKGSLNAQWERLRHWVHSRRLADIEPEFLKHLNHLRETGNKINEAKVYALYADFLENNERFSEALKIRTEAIRLARGFHLNLLLAQHLAQQAHLLARLGNQSESQKAAQEARNLLTGNQKLPLATITKVQEILASLPTLKALKTSSSLSLTDLQPLRSLVIPLEASPLETRLTLANYSDQQVNGTLLVKGLPLNLTTDQEQQEIKINLAPELVQTPTPSSLKISLEAGQFWFITLVAPADEAPSGNLSVLWTPDQSSPSQESLITLAEADQGINSAVIEAGEYRNHPFHGIMIHHHYADRSPTQKSPPVRFLSSHPARIEIYDGHDQSPIAVDANGNGSLDDPGDERFDEGNGQGELILPLNNHLAFIRLQVYPETTLPTEGLTIQFQIQTENGWETFSENRVIP